MGQCVDDVLELDPHGDPTTATTQGWGAANSANVLIEGAWAEAFIALAEGTVYDARSKRLLDDLVEAGSAVSSPAGHHLLPTRLSRWPIPYTDV